MATDCRGTKRVNRNKLYRYEAYAILGALALSGGVAGYAIAKTTTPKNIVTITETVEVPAHESLPVETEVVYYDVPLSHSLQKYIYEVCADENVPTSLVIAMIQHESNFNPEAVSTTNDYGLMQINEVNHEELEETYHTANLLDPYQNVFCGIKIIGSYLKKYGNVTKALMAYNMGEYGAKKAWENGVTSTPYSERIQALMYGYEGEKADVKS